jgi:protocatechuate 3,4-dioxygenase, alpha subunit
MSHPLTPSQTVGPYLHIGLDWLNIRDLAPPSIEGERITIHGRLLDADGQPIPDGMIELWQANTHGKYAHPADTQNLPLQEGFRGFGRQPTNAQGEFVFNTIKPGAVPAMMGQRQAPHILVSIFARGLLRQLVTRLYFPGDDHGSDPVLRAIPEARRATLIASPHTNDPSHLHWTIVIGGGADETVFFDL